jgi:hypothetical protein
MPAAANRKVALHVSYYFQSEGNLDGVLNFEERSGWEMTYG